VCDKTCIFFFFPITNKYFLMAKRSLLSRCPSYYVNGGCVAVSQKPKLLNLKKDTVSAFENS